MRAYLPTSLPAIRELHLQIPAIARAWPRLRVDGGDRQAGASQRAVAVSLVTDRGVLAAHNRPYDWNRTAGVVFPASTLRNFAMQRRSNTAIRVCVAFLKVLSILLLVVVAANGSDNRSGARIAAQHLRRL